MRPTTDRIGAPVTVERYAVVGGGIMGAAVARRLLDVDPTCQVTALERERDLALHPTGRNSGVVHAGPDYAPGSPQGTAVPPQETLVLQRLPPLRRAALAYRRDGDARVAEHPPVRRRGPRYVPELAVGDVVPGPSGIRAQAVDADGSLVDVRVTRRGRVLEVRDAPSPAATCSLAIAERLVEMLLDVPREAA